jgi:hypothetical protein
VAHALLLFAGVRRRPEKLLRTRGSDGQLPVRAVTPLAGASGPVSEARSSHVRIRTPGVMLVRIDPGHEPAGLRLQDLPYEVFRVRHPLPACTRMGTLRPAVVLVGKTVQPRDFVLMIAAADAIGAAIVLVDALVAPEGLYAWVVKSAITVLERRAEQAMRCSA